MPTFYVVRQANVVQIALGLGNLVLNVSGCDCKTSANQSLYASPRLASRCKSTAMQLTDL